MPDTLICAIWLTSSLLTVSTSGATSPRVDSALAYLLDDIQAQDELALGEDDGESGPFVDALEPGEEPEELLEAIAPSSLMHVGLEAWRAWSAPVEEHPLLRPLGPLASAYGALEDAIGQWFDEPFYPVRLSSRYGKRFHPVLKRWRLHNGIDLAARRGTPVRAAAAGQVSFSGWRGAAGKYVFIEHDEGWGTGYMHLHVIDDAVAKGARVERGQVIGQVGTTGRSTGPHLHFSVKKDGEYVDPLEARAFTYSPPIRGSGRLLYYELHVAPFLAERERAAKRASALAAHVVEHATR